MMQIKVRWTTIGLWLLASCIAALSCSLIKLAAHIGDGYFPVGHDSFYHAVRIFEAVRDPAAFYEFDPKIHAPEGSLLPWPWGYDYVMAMIVRAVIALGVDADPLTILSWIPVAAVFVGVGLLVLIARQLGLQDWPVALAALCMALNQTTQLLYGYGQIDHHFAEHIFLLASLAAGLNWLRTQSVPAALILGATFGISLAVHNALFILQLPLLVALYIRWLQGTVMPLKSALALIAGLLGSTLAVLIPSLPFQTGRFEFYTLSWFHFYIAGGTSLVVVFFARLRRNRTNIAALVLMGTLLLLPLIEQIQHAQSFVSGSLGMLKDIQEMQPPLELVAEGAWLGVSGMYSFFFWLAPITLALCVHRAWHERNEPRLLFWIMCVFGLPLLYMQVRMHYFGGFALYLPWIVVAQEFALRRQDSYRRTLLVASLLLVLAYMPVIRHALVAPVPSAGDQWFRQLYPLFPTLRQACAEDPGVVLADANAGHYIRYFTACSVIANNFLLTEQHFQKVDEVRRLFSLPPDEFAQQAPDVKYVLVRAGNIERKEDDRYSYSFFGDASRIPEALLLGPRDKVGPEFKLLFDMKIQTRREPEQNIPYAALYRVERRPASVE
jgi:hypothetical protein